MGSPRQRLHARRLASADRRDALDYLLPRAAENLVLIDFVARLGEGALPGESPPQIYGVFRAARLAGIVLLRPSVALSAGMDGEALEALMPFLLRVPSGLVKSDRRLVEPLWQALEATGRKATIDRIEVAYRLAPDQLLPVAADLPGVARPARATDLEQLVYAARASLWEEDRPDPAEGDPAGFRRWVESRLPRARVVCEGGRPVVVAYADVRRPEGWLIQGVYTWPEVRRRGFARRGMDSVIREAFASGATHVQLAVVQGNDRASRLYEKLGFQAFSELRTILFH